jgi:hypothetical protein
MSLASDFSALLMNRCSSSVGAYDLCGSSFLNVYSPSRVRTLERMVYSQLINADFPCSFGHEDIIRMSLDLPCRIAHTPFKYLGSGGGSLCARWVGTHQHPAIPNFDSEIGYPLLDF